MGFRKTMKFTTPAPLQNNTLKIRAWKYSHPDKSGVLACPNCIARISARSVGTDHKEYSGALVRVICFAKDKPERDDFFDCYLLADPRVKFYNVSIVRLFLTNI